MMLDQETLVWYSADAPPDDDTTVMINMPKSDEPVWLGWHEGIQCWHTIEGAELARGTVTAWAAMPTGAVRAEDAQHG
jgi:hypothetical protein